jgi:hypothetical protein
MFDKIEYQLQFFLSPVFVLLPGSFGIMQSFACQLLYPETNTAKLKIHMF